MEKQPLQKYKLNPNEETEELIPVVNDIFMYAHERYDGKKEGKTKLFNSLNDCFLGSKLLIVNEKCYSQIDGELKSYKIEYFKESDIMNSDNIICSPVKNCPKGHGLKTLPSPSANIRCMICK